MYSVQELSLSLTQGVWRHASWGYPVTPAPPGASVRARFLPSVATDTVDYSWEGFTEGLAGKGKRGLAVLLNSGHIQKLELSKSWSRDEASLR